MRYFIAFIVIGGFSLSTFAQEIFKTKLQGIAVQGFSPSKPINRFTVSGPDAEGYIYLKAHSKTSSGDILRTKWQGTAFQEFSLPSGGYITGFEASQEGEYVYLTAVGNGGQRGQILKTKWQGTAIQGYSASPGYAIGGFRVSEAGGWVELIADTVKVGPGIEEKFFNQNQEAPFVFALREITPNPCFGNSKISYSIAKLSKVNIQVYDCSGRFVKRLVDEEKKPGRYEVTWDRIDSKGRKLSAGIYFIKMDAGSFRAIRKVVVVR